MTQSELPLLTIVGGPHDGKTMPIAKPRVTLGRTEDNDVAVGEPWVSRGHAEIVRSDVGYHLRDLGSTNGTFVNGLGIGKEHLLRHGDHIGLGNSKVSLVFRTDAQRTVERLLLEPDSEQAWSPKSVPELVGAATLSTSPELSIVQYLESHPDGALFDTLRSLTGRPERETVSIVARLLDTRQIHQRDLTFFAGAGAAKHFCPEHEKSFTRYAAGGIELYAHIQDEKWCMEGDEED